MSFFDDSHVTDVGLQGSLGPSVGLDQMVAQSFRQQFRVDSARALDDELRNRWLESLRAAQITDQITVAPDPLGRNPRIDPDDPWAYRAFAQHVSGQPVDTFDPNRPLRGYDPTARIKGMIDANEKIKALNNPNIKSFEQILEEVAAMQQETEEETASMYERTGRGGFVASLLGSIAGSFTTRDPLNIITAPVGAGRTVFTRIASEMGLAAAVVGYTETAEVAPARQIAGLPERDPLYNIAAATIGAGAIRGGFEGIGYGISRLRTEPIDFDLRDSQLRQMFEANADKPSARAGVSILDDVKLIERNNPYGEGYQANSRFLAELQAVQRAMNGEPMTAVARVLPPIPYESLKKAADFEIVREQSPQIYAKMEAAQARVHDIKERLSGVNSFIEAFHGGPQKIGQFRLGLDRRGRPSSDSRNIVSFSSNRQFAQDYAGKEGEVTPAFVDTRNFLDFRNPDDVALVKQHWINAFNRWIEKAKAEYPEVWTEARVAKERSSWLEGVEEGSWTKWENASILDALQRPGAFVQEKNASQTHGINVIVRDLSRISKQKPDVKELNKLRRIANSEYQAAYREVEAEAGRIREQQARVEAVQQREASGILASEGLPFVGPLLRHDGVESLVDRINAFNDTLDERTAARFVRETIGEGENKVEVEVWEKDGGIDIGLRDPVDPNFTFMTDEGEMTVAQAMRDLQDDTDLVEAIKGCAI